MMHVTSGECKNDILHAVILFQATGDDEELNMIARRMQDYNQTINLISARDRTKFGRTLLSTIEEMIGDSHAVQESS